MPRLSRHWNQRETPRSADQTASALSVNIWKIASDALLALENEGFETADWSQRLDVIAQFAIFGVHLVDREAQSRLPDEERAQLIPSLARHLAALMQDNRLECDGPGEHATRFIEQLDAQAETYAGCQWSEEEGPGFALCRELGDTVAGSMGEKDQEWIATYVIDREAPKFATALRRVLRGLVAGGT